MREWNVKLLIGPYADADKAEADGKLIEPIDCVIFVYSTWVAAPGSMAIGVRAVVAAETAGDAAVAAGDAVRKVLNTDEAGIFEISVALAR